MRFEKKPTKVLESDVTIIDSGTEDSTYLTFKESEQEEVTVFTRLFTYEDKDNYH